MIPLAIFPAVRVVYGWDQGQGSLIPLGPLLLEPHNMLSVNCIHLSLSHYTLIVLRRQNQHHNTQVHFCSTWSGQFQSMALEEKQGKGSRQGFGLDKRCYPKDVVSAFSPSESSFFQIYYPQKRFIMGCAQLLPYFNNSFLLRKKEFLHLAVLHSTSGGMLIVADSRRQLHNMKEVFLHLDSLLLHFQPAKMALASKGSSDIMSSLKEWMAILPVPVLHYKMPSTFSLVLILLQDAEMDTTIFYLNLLQGRTCFPSCWDGSNEQSWAVSPYGHLKSEGTEPRVIHFPEQPMFNDWSRCI